MSTRPALDVRDMVRDVAFGARDPLAWGIGLMAAIEGTVFALLAGAYLFLRPHHDVWPVTAIGERAFWLETAAAAALFVSVVPTRMCNAAARAGRLKPTRAWLAVMTLLGAVALVLRVFEMRALGFRWDSHAYGSVFWCILGMHFFHNATGLLENALLTIFLFVGRGRVEKKHLTDVEANGFYWYFVALSWAPLYALLYLEPVVAR